MQLPFLFTDRHAYLAHKKVYISLADLDKLSWKIIKDDTWHTEYTELKKAGRVFSTSACAGTSIAWNYSSKR